MEGGVDWLSPLMLQNKVLNSLSAVLHCSPKPIGKILSDAIFFTNKQVQNNDFDNA